MKICDRKKVAGFCGLCNPSKVPDFGETKPCGVACKILCGKVGSNHAVV